MKFSVRQLVVGTLLGLLLAVPTPARAQAAIPGACVEDALDSGARSLICVPALGWNGQLVVYAHGYVAPGLPLDFYQLSLPDGTSLPTLLQSLGYAWSKLSGLLLSS